MSENIFVEEILRITNIQQQAKKKIKFGFSEISHFLN